MAAQLGWYICKTSFAYGNIDIMEGTIINVVVAAPDAQYLCYEQRLGYSFWLHAGHINSFFNFLPDGPLIKGEWLSIDIYYNLNQDARFENKYDIDWVQGTYIKNVITPENSYYVSNTGMYWDECEYFCEYPLRHLH